MTIFASAELSCTNRKLESRSRRLSSLRIKWRSQTPCRRRRSADFAPMTSQQRNRCRLTFPRLRLRRCRLPDLKLWLRSKPVLQFILQLRADRDAKTCASVDTQSLTFWSFEGQMHRSHAGVLSKDGAHFAQL